MELAITITTLLAHVLSSCSSEYKMPRVGIAITVRQPEHFNANYRRRS